MFAAICTYSMPISLPPITLFPAIQHVRVRRPVRTSRRRFVGALFLINLIRLLNAHTIHRVSGLALPENFGRLARVVPAHVVVGDEAGIEVASHMVDAARNGVAK